VTPRSPDLFGFSRGAFTARSVAGMVRNCGILKRESVRHYTDAIALYRDTVRGPDDPFSVDFRGAHCVCGDRGVPIRFIGVWDTVGALAIDERRAPFTPTLWYQKPKPDQTVEQVWFAGVHSDVGGGYPRAGLSDIALEWMLDRAMRVGGLSVDHRGRITDTPDTTQSVHPSVRERWDQDPGFRPKGLREYFERVGG
jgi:uncharacterized protein (DUF2235 family)